MSTRHFLTLTDLTPDELGALIARAGELKAAHRRGDRQVRYPGKVMAMLFEKSSTRTRASFEAAWTHLGGHSMFLSPRDIQLGRGETVEDSARVLSRMVDVLVVRTAAHERLELLAANSTVPVINALTDRFHPCQLLADILTWTERHGDIRGRTAAFIGDGNNVCQSWIKAARLFGFELRIAAPAGYRPEPELLATHADCVQVTDDPAAAAAGADVVVTDVWASMGQEDESAARQAAFAGYQVDPALMTKAAPAAIFMHCLPAHRGEEVAAAVIDGPQSVVWDEAENRLHAQKALLELLLG
ncbi:MAG TPA: ornithine carbamoyltransferase [Gammaproteobacteria bacterium]|uniref:ornithine carbamoyltransferase n=1 Tax=Immundisolibacter sp. TaxID=1934948 RepID=UPI000E94EB9D|nr:ornithine carbamoyltransferase [Gammaproteobacteria bacterium]HCZ48829.1 ornithine carbamoyltransferase [Gammaproteobacteria bacterium]MCH78267.1 ornithine carbamoyltransferase [Gammaproteobacteria bacterium]